MNNGDKGSLLSSNGQNGDIATMRSKMTHVMEENQLLLRTIEKNFRVDISGYLFLYEALAAGWLSSPWVRHYVSLTGTLLSYAKTPKNIESPVTPCTRVSIEGCIVEVEGIVKGRLCFTIKDREGLHIARLGSADLNFAQLWIKELVKVGCDVRYLNDSYRLNGLKATATQQATSRPGTANGAGRALDGTAKAAGPPSRVSSGVPAVEADDSSDGSSSAITTESWREKHAPKPSGRGAQKTYTSDSGVSDAGTSTAGATGKAAKKRDFMTGSTTVHSEVRPSMLSSARLAFTQQYGLLILLTIIVITTNLRLIVENILKYGVLTRPQAWVLALVPRSNPLLLLAWVAMAACILTAWIIENIGCNRLKAERKGSTARRKRDLRPSDARRLAVQMRYATEWALFVLNLANTSAVLLVPCGLVMATRADIIPGFLVTISAVILWLKLVSYAHCNCDLRCKKRAADVDRKAMPSEPVILEEGAIQAGATLAYPGNLTLRNLADFITLPTLVYQMAYPRTREIRWRWLLMKFVELLMCTGLQLIIVEQYIQPTIANGLTPWKELQWPKLIERVLKLSLPTVYGWLIMFYSVFHLLLNIIAELTGFEDREFYKGWWNAGDVAEYWRLWNMPVHKWLLRHVYYPCMRLGMGKWWAGTVVFAISAAFHELLIGLPLHMITFWAFIGLMCQVPLMGATSHLRKKCNSAIVGNFIFWTTFCVLGQPICIMMYYYAWVLENRPDWLPPDKKQ